MSAALAAGWARSSDQSVSVVPTIQCRPHGMTNSTDFSVRRISPASDRIRSRGTTRWMPLLARTWNCPRSPASALGVVGPHAGGVDDLPGPDVERPPRLQVVHLRADDPLALAQQADHPRAEATCAPYAAAVRAMNIVCRASSTWRVVVLQRADQRVLLQRRARSGGRRGG